MAKKAKDSPVEAPAAVATPVPAAVAAPDAAAVAATDAMDDLTAMAMDMAPAATTETKGKSKVPTINIPEVMESCKEFVDATREIADAEAKQGRAATKIKAVAELRRIQASREMGEHQTSINVNGQVTYIVQNRYLKIADTAKTPLATLIAKLTGIFGEAYKTYFVPAHEFSVKKEATTAKNIKILQELFKDDPVRRQALATVIGCAPQDIPKFSDLIERESTLKPTEAFHIARTMKPDVALLAEQAKVAGIVTPISPSLKA